MTTLQIRIDNELETAIKQKSKQYKVPASSLVKIILVKTFLSKQENFKPGNVFNADRDAKGKGIFVDDFINAL